MLSITMKLLEQRLREVDREILRVMEIPYKGQHTVYRRREVDKLRAYRRQVVQEMETIEQM